MADQLKRKHVVFSEDTGPSSSLPAVPSGPYVHPSRAAASAVLNGSAPTAPAAKKPKTVAKKRYLKAKARKHKTLKAAKKASAPKNKDKKLDSAEDGTIEENAEAGPSSPVASTTVDAESKPVKKDKKSKKDKGKEKEKIVDDDAIVPGGANDEESARLKRKEEKRAKREARRLNGEPKADKTEEVGNDRIVPGGANDEESARLQRKEEKRAKREARRSKREAEAEEEEAKDRVVPQLLSTQPGNISDSDNEDDDPDMDDDLDSLDDGDETDPDDLRSLSGSPPPLEAFPLPTSAPAPDASLLSRQGLPTGLGEATFIPQDLRLSVDSLEITKAGRTIPALSDRMKERLSELGISEFFAVQAYMLPRLLALRLIPWPNDPRNDFLISAPTGSGKTLAYCVPITEVLSQRVVTRLRALIVLPTRDLVVQVRETLEMLSKGTSLKIGVVGGQHSFKHEQNAIIDDMESKLLGGSSKVDILIATPGRLMEHLTTTPNFTLQHLRFLLMDQVIDEADRLLNQSFQNWLSKVLSHLRPPTTGLPEGFVRKPNDRVAEAWLEAYGLHKPSFEQSRRIHIECQKLLFSATLTRDPAKVAALDLHKPEYYIVQSSSIPQTAVSIGEQFSLPSELNEKMTVLDPALKPLALIHLIHHPEYMVRSALVFTKSVESATRLVQLLDGFEEVRGSGVVVRSYTSEMKPGERKRLLADFAKGTIHLLICSDLIARGMDLPSVAHVVSYDIPLDMRKYVHRVGRTARAGRSGTAWSLVENQEALHFKNMMKSAGREDKVAKLKIKERDLEPYQAEYKLAIDKLKKVYSRQKDE